MVGTAGTPNCCSVCGDADVAAYEVVGQKWAVNAPVTMRLCDDCKGIRTGQFGENYRAIDERDLVG